MKAFFARGLTYLKSMRQFNRNCWLIFASAGLSGAAQGIFLVVFNLYILSLGIAPDTLGGILSAAPFAQAIGSIPLSFMAETLGFKRIFVLIFLLSGLAKVGQIATRSVPLIALAAFVDGLALSGSFVIRLPFLAANTDGSDRTRVYTLNSMSFSISLSVGSLLAGYLPNLFDAWGADLSTAYQYTLYAAGAIALLAVLPVLRLDPTPTPRRDQPGIRSYLWGMSGFTIKLAVIALFVGLSLGSIGPFMNLYFIYHLGTTPAFYGTVSALAVIPAILGTALIPPIEARSDSRVTLVTILRALIPLFLVGFTLTTNRWLGTTAYWAQHTLFFMTQPVAFAFAMDAARRDKAVVSAWLNIAFWLGNALAAPLVGALLADEAYRTPLHIAAAAVALSALLNQGLFVPVERRLKEGVT
jgi:MFS family permease